MPGRLDQSADRKTSGDAEDVLEACAALEAELAELRAAYEQYFLGVERHPPVARHDALKRKMQELKGRFTRQTAAKFRIQTVSARMTTFERLWDRSLKEIEAGTYRRDLNRAKRHQKERELRQKKANVSGAEDLDLSDLEGDLEGGLAKAIVAASGPASAITSPTGVATAAAPPPPPPSIPPAAKPSVPAAPIVTPPPVRPMVTPAFATAPPGRPSSAQAPAAITDGLTDQKIKAIYDAYVMAKRRCGEDTKGLTLDSVASTLRKQVPELMKQHQAKSVEFKVVIKDGRAVLRALPRE